MYGDVDKAMGCCGTIGGLQEHRATILVEELWGAVDMVICSGVRAANDHDSEAGSRGRGWMVDAVIVDGWLEQVRVVL